MVRNSLEGMVGSLGYTPVGPVRAEGNVYRTEGSQLVVSGELTLSVTYQCVRCLAERDLCFEPKRLRVGTT